MDPFKPDPIFSFGTAPDARFSPPAFQNHFGWPSAYDATQNPSHGGPTATSAPVSGPYQYQYQQQHWSPGGALRPFGSRMYPRVYNDSADLVWLNRKSLRWSAARNCGSLGSAVFHGGNVSVSYALSVAFDVD